MLTYIADGACWLLGVPSNAHLYSGFDETPTNWIHDGGEDGVSQRESWKDKSHKHIWWVERVCRCLWISLWQNDQIQVHVPHDRFGWKLAGSFSSVSCMLENLEIGMGNLLDGSMLCIYVS